MVMSLTTLPLGTVVPGRATGTSEPGTALGAPAMICSTWPPRSTRWTQEVVARFRMLGLLDDLADDDLGEVDHGQRLHLHAEPREHVGGVLGRDTVEVDEVG